MFLFLTPSLMPRPLFPNKEPPQPPQQTGEVRNKTKGGIVREYVKGDSSEGFNKKPDINKPRNDIKGSVIK